MPTILVTGGCGYIASHATIDLIDNGFDVICVDSNVRSSADILKAVQLITGKKVPHYAIDICNLSDLQEVFKTHPDIQGIIHFAAYKSVPESVASPLKYYDNNLNGLLNVLTCIEQFNIPNFIFSSSCSVYGNSTELPVKETTPLNKAQSPYAYTKQVSERMIEDFSAINASTNSILLRYFNPGGAHPSAKLGEIPQKGAYNVIPILIEALTGQRDTFQVTGNDYDTRDGSCVRDYIHIMDLANAHTKALQYLIQQNNDTNCEIFNIGIGDGVSVLELIGAFNRAVGRELDYIIGPRRTGDVAAIYADSTKSKERLQWEPKYTVDDILSTAWQWYLTGYKLG